jgi:hypothetical protein
MTSLAAMSKFGKDLIASMKQAAAYAKGRKVRGMRVTTRVRKEKVGPNSEAYCATPASRRITLR